jgi:hypothetical protein
MKKTSFFVLSIGILFLVGCNCHKNTSGQPIELQDSITQVENNYLGSYFKENYVWGGAMNLAWSELNENILHEKLQFNTEDKIALEMAEKLNNPIFTKNDLDDKSYYIKSGYGQSTVNTINKETKLKFPSKSFSDLNLSLSPTDIISYAYFLKEVEYSLIFDIKEVSFNGKMVKGFYAKDKSQKYNVKIIKYESDEKFIVSLQLKDENDQLILAKGYDMTNPQIVVNEINQNNKANLSSMGIADRFEAPKLKLDYSRDYVELIGKYLANKGFESYFIAKMFENIKFDMDEKGARVENEAVIVLSKSIEIDSEKPKNLLLDKPYWVVMKRSNSSNPYFILGINNIELMEKN